MLDILGVGAIEQIGVWRTKGGFEKMSKKFVSYAMVVLMLCLILAPVVGLFAIFALVAKVAGPVVGAVTIIALGGIAFAMYACVVIAGRCDNRDSQDKALCADSHVDERGGANLLPAKAGDGFDSNR